MDEKNINNNEIQNQNENLTENEVIRDSEISKVSESVCETETINDEEDNSHARSTKGEEEESEDIDESDESGETSSSAGGAGSAAGAAGAAGASVAVIAAVAIIISGVISGISAAFTKLDVFGTYFSYVLTVSMEYTETEDSTVDFNNVDTGLLLVVTKRDFSKTVRLVTGEGGVEHTLEKVPIDGKENTYKITLTFSGTVEGLDENTRYKLSVIGDEDGKTVTYLTESIKTTARVSEFRGVSSHCSCDKDGMFNFKIDFDDENDFYSDFAYEFKNDSGETVRFGIIDDPKVEVHIPDVGELPGTDYILVISYTSVAESDVEADGVESSYNDGNVKVLIDHGKVTITARVKI